MLTQLNTVKLRLGLALYETQQDPLLQQFIRLTSSRFELECGRRFAWQGAAVQEFPAQALSVLAERYPIQSVQRFELAGDDGQSWVEVPAPGHRISLALSAIELAEPLGSTRDRARVTYAGGYILPGETPQPGQTALPEELDLACAEQVAYLFDSRKRLGLASIGGAGGGLGVLEDLDLLKPSANGNTSGSAWLKFLQADFLPSVQSIIDKYRRIEW